MSASGILLISCPDKRGIVASVADFIYQRGGNVVHADQHRDDDVGSFFTRIEWSSGGSQRDVLSFADEFKILAERFSMTWRLEDSSRSPRVALYVSKYQHCLLDLLHRQQIGELHCSIEYVLSNHPDAEEIARFFHVPFYHVPFSAQSKEKAEAEQLRLAALHNIDLVVLARYMQVLSPVFVAHFPARIINVHHSFLPAFTGAKPHHAAYERGVKLIGATSHYVTDALDEGPIIEQDVARISHRDQVEDLVQKGRDLEKIVLSRAVRWHLQHRILTYGNKTVVFD